MGENINVLYPSPSSSARDKNKNIFQERLWNIFVPFDFLILGYLITLRMHWLQSQDYKGADKINKLKNIHLFIPYFFTTRKRYYVSCLPSCNMKPATWGTLFLFLLLLSFYLHSTLFNYLFPSFHSFPLLGWKWCTGPPPRDSFCHL